MTAYDDLFSDDFWKDSDEAMFEVIFPEIERSVLAGAGGEAARLGLALSWDLVNEEARQFARDYTYELVKGISWYERSVLQDFTSRWIVSGKPLHELENDLITSGLFSLDRAHMIAVTEVTRAFAIGNTKAWYNAGVEGKQWRTAEDEKVCPICGRISREQEFVGITSGFTTKFGESPTPPGHVMCRCWLGPAFRDPATGAFKKIDDDWQQQPFRRLDANTKTDEMLNNDWESFYSAINSRQKSALRHYTGSGYNKMNSMLRGHRPWEPGNWAEDEIKLIDEAFGFAPQMGENTIVYRSMSRSHLPDIAGQEFIDKGIISTTIDNYTAKHWHGDAVCEIRVSAKARAIWARPISEHSSEWEVLFARNSKFKVLSIQENVNEWAGKALYILELIV